ncbi:MgtC/SapB family protein, partial [bacterium]|nr:MgtC/SapB family protein [bacterium]
MIFEGELWWRLGLALGLGLLVGLQRQWSGHLLGIRTFPLITLMGVATAAISGPSATWVVATGLLVLGAVLVVATRLLAVSKNSDFQVTTLVAALVMYLVGAMIGRGYTVESIALAGVTAVLLQWKAPLHQFVERIGKEQIRAVFKLVLLALVILPVMPNRAYGPYGVLNPFHIWSMVVLIVGISLVGYLLSKYVSPRTGSVLAGVLGGLISSTATTVSYARRTEGGHQSAGTATLVIMIASTLALLRIAAEVVVAAREHSLWIVPQFAVLAGWMALICVVIYGTAGKSAAPDTPQTEDDPLQFRASIAFGLLYAFILLAVAAAESHLGKAGMYAVATLSGLTDVDAITLSTAELINTGRVPVDTGWRMMFVASMANLVFKGVAVALLGSRRLLVNTALAFGLSLLGGALLLVYWPLT